MNVRKEIFLISVLIFLLVPVFAQQMPPSPESVQMICTSTNGTWIDDQCTCPENMSFTPRWGCQSETPMDLCQNTGGTWKSSSQVTEGLIQYCECPIGRTFDAEKGCIFSSFMFPAVIIIILILLFIAYRMGKI